MVVHEKLKPDWLFPAIPEGYDFAVITEYTSGEIKTDFIAEEKRCFGFVYKNTRIFSIHSKAEKPKLVWPWIKGFSPSIEDWREIGFKAHYGFDAPTYLPKYSDWIDR